MDALAIATKASIGIMVALKVSAGLGGFSLNNRHHIYLEYFNSFSLNA